MNKISLKYGLISGGIMILLFLIPYLIWGIEENDMDTGEIIGYTTMILSLLGIFLGIKNYRNKQLNGVMSYWSGLKTGLGITLIASLMFGIYAYILCKFVMPDFSEKYYLHTIEKIKNSNQSKEAIQKQISEMEAFIHHPILSSMEFQAFIMFATVFIIGLLISLVSAAVLRKGELKTVS